ncbi:MAG: hypothetical protein DRN96_04780 [Thermoproteota archaeon]|nr:MAG: hypothetical protein DRN96_04780 [Candidatus Korarchaeota archaeon]
MAARAKLAEYDTACDRLLSKLDLLLKVKSVTLAEKLAEEALALKSVCEGLKTDSSLELWKLHLTELCEYIAVCSAAAPLPEASYSLMLTVWGCNRELIGEEKLRSEVRRAAAKYRRLAHVKSSLKEIPYREAIVVDEARRILRELREVTTRHVVELPDDLDPPISVSPSYSGYVSGCFNTMKGILVINFTPGGTREELVSVIAHEVYPGHHVQRVFTSRADLPATMKLNWVGRALRCSTPVEEGLAQLAQRIAEEKLLEPEVAEYFKARRELYSRARALIDLLAHYYGMGEAEIRDELVKLGVPGEHADNMLSTQATSCMDSAYYYGEMYVEWILEHASPLLEDRELSWPLYKLLYTGYTTPYVKAAQVAKLLEEEHPERARSLLERFEPTRPRYQKRRKRIEIIDPLLEEVF